MFDRSLPLLQQREGKLGDLLLKRHHPGFQAEQPLDQLSLLREERGQPLSGLLMPSLRFRCVESLPLRLDWTNCGRSMEWATVRGCYVLDLFLCHAFAACIRGMSYERDIRLLEPVVEGLGMNTKQTSSVCNRK